MLERLPGGEALVGVVVELNGADPRSLRLEASVGLVEALRGEGFDNLGRLRTDQLGVTITDLVEQLSTQRQIPFYQPMPGTARLVLAQR